MDQLQDTVEMQIHKTPGVCGGDACVGATRIPVWLLVSFRKRGASEADLLVLYPQLAPEHLRLAWNYYEAHRDEIDRNIREQDEI